MWSFLASVIVFLTLIAGLGTWQWRTRRVTKAANVQVDQQINEVAEVAQRRHKQRFGRASTDLEPALNGAARHAPSK